jgi:hypothetical protein
MTWKRVRANDATTPNFKHTTPRRPDRRRSRGNATDAQRRPRRARPGRLEAIAERRVRALELRKAGAPYRQIASDLGVDVHTAHADVAAELADLREAAVQDATELRALELERLDGMTSGLWPQIREGSPPAVTAAVRVSERRARLLGLDEPVVTKSELTGSLTVTAQTQLKAQAEELQTWLTFDQLRDLAEKSDKLFADAFALVKARRTPVLGVSPLLTMDVVAVATVEPAEQHGPRSCPLLSAAPPTEARDSKGQTAPEQQ